MYGRLVTTCAVLLAALLVVAAPSGAAAQEAGWEAPWEESEDEEPIVHDRTSARLGLLVNGLFASEGSAPFRYFDFGVRHKSGEYHVELRAGGLAVLVDVVYMLMGWATIGVPSEPLFQKWNPSEPGHWELGHGRLGYRFLLVPPGDFELWSEPIETSVGFFGTADLLSFGQRNNVDPAEVSQYGYGDPLVLGGGAFVSFGKTREEIQYDVAFGVGRAIRGVENNPERRVTMVTTDLDVQFAAGDGPLAIYLRPRLTGYITRLDPAINVAGGLTGGVTLGF